MVDFMPFRALRPAPGRAADVADVPYDVVDTREAQALVDGRPDSILRTTRPDVSLPAGASLYSEAAYAEARRAFGALIEGGALVEDERAGFYVYAQTMGSHRQVGLVGLASAADYRADRIKKHEHTRPKKEDDRMRHIEAVRAHIGPVLMAHRAHSTIDGRIERVAAGPAEVDFVAPDGIRHQLWPVFDTADVSAFERDFRGVDALYIADGHHRSAAAARVGAGAGPDETRGRFLVVTFPHDQLQILAYNRVVVDRNGRSPEALVIALADAFEVTRLTGAATPDERHTFTMFTAGEWYHLRLKPEAAPDPDDPVARLDVSVLQDVALAPLLGVGDPRTDERIGFVGGVRGTAELERRAGEDGVAFAMYPTSLEDLMSIADAGEVMPPKSTWFEPKLRTGMVVSRY